MSIKIVIPMEPVNVNNYVRHTRSGRHYKTQEAKSFEEIGAISCRGLSVSAKEYFVTVDIYQGYKQRGDIDNYLKQVLDLLAQNGVLLDKKGKRSTDAHVTKLLAMKHRDIENPRTEIVVEGL